MNRLKIFVFSAALAFTTSAFAGGTIGFKVGNGDLEGTNAGYTAGSTTQASLTKSKDAMFGAIFAEINLGDTPFSAGLEYVPLDADITLDGSNSSTSANVDDYTTLYLLLSKELDAASVYAKLGYSQADIGTINASENTTVNSQDDTLEGPMIGVGVQTQELANGMVGRFEVTYTEFDSISATTTSNGSASVKKTADGELLTITLGLSKAF
tara:strand:+ start:483 stop:1115 length:633 start_codon:yes stop_codon:yes gene_type:complete